MKYDQVPSEIEQIKGRYERRIQNHADVDYSPLAPFVYMTRLEKERVLIRLIKKAALTNLKDRFVLEVGCGFGGNLALLQRLGFRPNKMVGCDLLSSCVQGARQLLPSDVRIIEGDPVDIDLPPQSFDVVMQSTVFSSILDDEFQQHLAKRMWWFVRPGGGILWYDFVYNNPRNRDVRGVPLRRIKELFPCGKVMSWRLTLAPPLCRAVTKVHPSLYSLLNVLPFLRTHLLCWIERPK